MGLGRSVRNRRGRVCQRHNPHGEPFLGARPVANRCQHPVPGSLLLRQQSLALGSSGTPWVDGRRCAVGSTQHDFNRDRDLGRLPRRIRLCRIGAYRLHRGQQRRLRFRRRAAICATDPPLGRRQQSVQGRGHLVDAAGQPAAGAGDFRRRADESPAVPVRGGAGRLGDHGGLRRRQLLPAESALRAGRWRSSWPRRSDSTGGSESASGTEE